MYVLLGRYKAMNGTAAEGMYCVDDTGTPTEQFLLHVDGDIEENAPLGPIFMTENAAHSARLGFRGHRICSDTGLPIIWEKVVELDPAKIKAFVESVPNYKDAFVEALRCGNKWSELDPRRGAVHRLLSNER